MVYLSQLTQDEREEFWKGFNVEQSKANIKIKKPRNKLEHMLREYIEREREIHGCSEFLTQEEHSLHVGVHDILDDIELILNGVDICG